MSILDALFKPTYLREAPAFFHPRILVGPGAYLDLFFVNKYNITHVINCAFDYDSPKWWRVSNEDKYVVLNAIDSVNTNILDWYPDFETAMKRFLREGDGVVYVHCQAGMNRSGSLALAYTCKNLGMELDPLVQSVRRQRPCILQNPVFMNQVREFINGRVQDSKDTGLQSSFERDRYSGLLAPGYRSNTQGLQNQTGNPSPRDSGFASGNIAPLFYK